MWVHIKMVRVCDVTQHSRHLISDVTEALKSLLHIRQRPDHHASLCGAALWLITSLSAYVSVNVENCCLCLCLDFISFWYCLWFWAECLALLPQIESLPPPLHYNAPGCSLLFCFYSITPAKAIKRKNTDSPCCINKSSIIVPDTHWRVKRVRVRVCMCWGSGSALGSTARCDAAQNPSCYFNHPSSSPLAPSVSLLLSLCC